MPKVSQSTEVNNGGTGAGAGGATGAFAAGAGAAFDFASVFLSPFGFAFS